MRILNIALLACLLPSCAAPVFKVPLTLPEGRKVNTNLVVKDARLDKTIYMTGISAGSESHIYLLTSEPAIETALEQHLSVDIDKEDARRNTPKIDITIDDLDLKDKVGFGKADELYCKIESTVMIFKDTAKPIEVKVKTFTKNVENMSSFIDTSARVILDQCLQKHALDIFTQIKTPVTNP